MLVEPVSEHVEVALVAWDGQSPLPPAVGDAGTPLVFCQLPPPASVFERAGARVVWLPMFDQADGYGTDWWNGLDKRLRVVSFSRALTRRAQAVGLKVLPLQLFKNPRDFAPANWSEGLVGFYWNRTGLASPRFLERFCATLQLKKLLFLPTLDPHIPTGVAYSLPPRLGGAVVQQVGADWDRAAFLKSIEKANVFLAPRAREGVGMLMLELMARGCAVFAYDGPTMSEYVAHGENGYLFPRAVPRNPVVNLTRRLGHAAKRRMGVPAPAFGLDDRQNWPALAAVSPRRIGDCARQRSEAGFAAWVLRHDEYASFLLDWGDGNRGARETLTEDHRES
jgi:glycosyltransferase involved in cell wall biosynthesis